MAVVAYARGYRGRAALLGGVFALLHAVWWLPLPLGLRGLAAEALLLAPGALFALLLTRAEGDAFARGFVALCAGLAVQVLLLLGLQAMPGGLAWWQVLLPCDLLALTLGWQLVRAPDVAGEQHAALRWWKLALALGVLAFAACFRLPFLGSAEFQGDEANAMLLALEAVNGRGDILLWHTKGPAEVLLPLGTLALLGTTNEFVARLPFALAGLGVPLGVFVVARRMAGTGGGAIGLIAAAILALDGFLIAFSRIVQYQSVVLLMAVGAVWCCWRCYGQAARPLWLLVTAAAFASVGLLAHYDAVFVLPALAWLVAAAGVRRRWNLRQWALCIGLPCAVGAALLASFYLPFVLHEHFQRTLHYVGARTGQAHGGFKLFNKLAEYYLRATFYNTTFQMVACGLALLAGVAVWLGRYCRPRLLGWLLAAGMLAASVPLARDAGSMDMANGNSLAIAVFALPLAALILAPATPIALRTLLLWFAPAFIAETFLVAQPKTHFYTMDTAAALLISMAVVQCAQWLAAHRLARLRWALAGLGAALVALAAPYMFLMFVRQTPEYRMVFPTARPAIYRSVYGDDLSLIDGFFGFPHRSGWKVIGELYRSGVLKGHFASNEDFLMAHWYTRKQSTCDAAPDYYFMVAHPIDLNRALIAQVQATYHMFGTVTVDGAQTIAIYRRQPLDGPPRTFALDDYVGSDERVPLVRSPAQQTHIQLTPSAVNDTAWQQGLTLRGADLGDETLVAGQDTTFKLRWSAAAPLATAYMVTASLVDAAGHATAIGEACQAIPATAWHEHKSNLVSFAWVADPQLAPGSYTLHIALRDPQTGTALPLANGDAALTAATLVITK